MFRSFFYSLSKVSRNMFSEQTSLSVSRLKGLNITSFRYKTDSKSNSALIPGALSSRYEEFTEKGPIILDIEEERQKIHDKQEPNEVDRYLDINLERGVSGVFEIEELVKLLRNEKAKDIFVVKIPPEYGYVDYMVIVTGTSNRHMRAMCEFIRHIFKVKMHKNDMLPRLEGKTSKDWMALDLGNIVLHVFSKSARVQYDLETLWAIGKEYDSLSQEDDSSQNLGVLVYADLLAKLTPDSPSKAEQ